MRTRTSNVDTTSIFIDYENSSIAMVRIMFVCLSVNTWPMSQHLLVRSCQTGLSQDLFSEHHVENKGARSTQLSIGTIDGWWSPWYVLAMVDEGVTLFERRLTRTCLLFDF